MWACLWRPVHHPVGRLHKTKRCVLHWQCCCCCCCCCITLLFLLLLLLLHHPSFSPSAAVVASPFFFSFFCFPRYIWMVHAGCVFVASIYPSRIWMSGSFESVRWNACVHGLDHSSERVLEKGARTYVNSKGKIPSTRGSEEGWTCAAASCRIASPTLYRLSYSRPCTPPFPPHHPPILALPQKPLFLSLFISQRCWTKPTFS